MSASNTGRAFVFPGQGSQAVGMGKELADAHSEARQVFEAVDDALGEKLSTLMFEGPDDDLRLTRNAQPALMAVSMAVLKVLETKSGKGIGDLCGYVAGHSLGEYSALAAANSIDIVDAARLLRLRGESMQNAVPVGDGAMAAILGVDLAVAKEIADEAGKKGVCDVANDNADGQVVLSGEKAAIDKAIEVAVEKGAKKSVLLPVSAPFHCSMMAPAADVMADALKQIDLRTPVVPVVANVTAAPESDPEAIRQLLVQQVTGMVRWRESVLKMAEIGVTEIVEVGAGKVLAGLTRRIDRSVTGKALNGPGDIDSWLEAL